MNEQLRGAGMQEQIKVEDYVKVGRNMIADLRAGAMSVLSNKHAAASLLELIVDRLAFLEQEALTPRGGAITLERERSLFHIVCGSQDWNPTEEDIQKIADLFKKAEYDKDGNSFVATRDGVSVMQITGTDLGTFPFVKDE